MNKRGISEILATLMIILFVLVAAVIIWVVIRNVIGSGSEEIELSGARLYLSIENAYLDVENGVDVIKVTVSREGEGNLTGVKFVFSDSENSYSVDRKTPITELGKRTFTFNSTEIGVSSVTSLSEVSVAPIYAVGDRERVGPVTNTGEIEAGGTTPPPPGQFTLTVSTSGTGTGTVASSPTGISCGTDCTENYDSGTSVTLTATPASGSTFAGWSGGGCTGTGTCAVSMTQARSVTATFTSTTTQYTVTVTKAGTGSGTVTSSPTGINCGTDCTENYNSGTSVTLTATANSGSTFSGWSGGGCTGTGTCTVSMTQARSVTATFNSASSTFNLGVIVSRESLIITSSPAGINCGPGFNQGDCNEIYASGTSVTLTASPSTGYKFSEWGTDCSGTQTTCQLTMSSSKSVIANPVPQSWFRLTVDIRGGGSGFVLGSSGGGNGIDCGLGFNSCTEDYVPGTSVTLTATPASGSTFGGWGGACTGTGTCTVSMTQARSVTATFSTTSSTFTLSVSIYKNGDFSWTGASPGTVTSSPAGINCAVPLCSASFASGTSVTLTATPANGYFFNGWASGWSGGCSGTGTCTITMTSSKSAAAQFNALQQ